MNLERHPCFSNQAHGRYGRLHIPCAPACNLDCSFCGRGIDPADSRVLPGRAERLVTSLDAGAYVAARLAQHPEIQVLGVAGPGEPLANEATFEVLASLGAQYPQMLLCLGTNGLLLPEYAPRLQALGVSALTVTVNFLAPETGARLCPRVHLDGRWLEGTAGARQLVARQIAGIERARALGLAVKLNTVLVPGINEQEMVPIARLGARLGVTLMNVMPLKPAGRLASWPAPSEKHLCGLRCQLETILPQFLRCSQCRADACGVPGRDEERGYGCHK